MRIPARNVLLTGQHRCPEFDYHKELPKEFDVLLCLLDGAERRLQLQAEINAVGAEARREEIDLVRPRAKSCGRKSEFRFSRMCGLGTLRTSTPKLCKSSSAREDVRFSRQ